MAERVEELDDLTVGEYIRQLETENDYLRERNHEMHEALLQCRRDLVAIRDEVDVAGKQFEEEYNKLFAAYEHYRDWALTAEWMAGVHDEAWVWDA